jgi:hypothetical protein
MPLKASNSNGAGEDRPSGTSGEPDRTLPMDPPASTRSGPVARPPRPQKQSHATQQREFVARQGAASRTSRNQGQPCSNCGGYSKSFCPFRRCSGGKTNGVCVREGGKRPLRCQHCGRLSRAQSFGRPFCSFHAPPKGTCNATDEEKRSWVESGEAARWQTLLSNERQRRYRRGKNVVGNGDHRDENDGDSETEEDGHM